MLAIWKKGLKVFYLLVSLAAAVAALVWAYRWWLLGSRPPRMPRTDEIGQVVVLAYEAEWASRFGVTVDRLRAALFGGADAALRDRVASEVGVVDLRFDASQPATVVATTISVTYRTNRQRSTATMTLPWDDVPQTVRADILGHPDNDTVSRTWRAAA